MRGAVSAVAVREQVKEERTEVTPDVAPAVTGCYAVLDAVQFEPPRKAPPSQQALQLQVQS